MNKNLKKMMIVRKKDYKRLIFEKIAFQEEQSNEEEIVLERNDVVYTLQSTDKACCSLKNSLTSSSLPEENGLATDKAKNDDERKSARFI